MFYSLGLLDRRRKNTLKWLQQKTGNRIDDFWEQLEVLVFEQCFPVEQIRSAFRSRHCHNYVDNLGCAELLLQLVSTSRWRNYRKRLNAYLHEQKTPNFFTLPPLQLVSVKPWDRYPQLWLKMDSEQLPLPAIQPCSNPKTAETGFIQCPFCQSYDTETESLQIRSADEGMTTFLTCYSCKRERINLDK